jgi:hypothetical protein
MDQSAEDSGGSIALLVLIAAEEKYKHCIFLFLHDPFNLLGDEDGQHCFSLARASRYPKEMRIAMQPRPVDLILCNPFTGTSDSFSFRGYKALSIDVRIGEEESVLAGTDLVLQGFYQNPFISDRQQKEREGERARDSARLTLG